MILYLSRTRRYVNRKVYNDRKNVSATTYLNICGLAVFVCAIAIVFNITRCCSLGVDPLKLSPRRASLLGGSPITVSGPCFTRLSCRFDNTVVTGNNISPKKAICVAPMFVRVGVIPVSVSVNGGFTFMPAGDINVGRTAHSLEWRFVLQQCHSKIDCHLLLDMDLLFQKCSSL